MVNGSVVEGTADKAAFTLKIHRGEGMALLAMNWKDGQPPHDFVGFAIEYQPPDSSKFFAVKNRLNFEGNAGSGSSVTRPPSYSTLVAPIQKFRWIHFPFNADLKGDFTYRVTPVFMTPGGDLHYDSPQTASLELARETYPGVLNVAFTRGFVSSQAFVDRYVSKGPIETLLPGSSKDGLTFKPTHPSAADAYDWMGFEARKEILATLDAAIADKAAQVGVVAYDFDLPEIIDRVKALGKDRVRVIIDDSDNHHGKGAAEDGAQAALEAVGIPVVRQHLGNLQHNKTIYVDAPSIQRVVCGSTNMSWRGFFVQSNNAVIIEGKAAVDVFKAAFEQYWSASKGFKSSPSASWIPLGLDGVNVSITFSPHGKANSALDGIGDDIGKATSSVLYSLAFLSITPGVIRNALAAQTNRDDVFVAGIADKKTGITVTSGSSNLPPTYVEPLGKDAPKPFSTEPTGLTSSNGGTRMHHKFIVLDFNTDDARVYLGSYNMSKAADGTNGENLVLIRDSRVATAYMVEAMSMIDHYEFRVAQLNAKTRKTSLALKRPPSEGTSEPWFAEDWTDPRKIHDRLLFG